MTTAPFFTTRLGRAALVSIAAMLAMNLVVLARQAPALPDLGLPYLSVPHLSVPAASVTTSVSAITGGVA